jgi:phage tail sheath gpL-like
VRTGVVSGDTGAEIATALAAAVNADTSLPVTAAVDGVITTQVNLTCRWKGETGNDIDLRVNYYDEKTPAGLTVAIAAMSDGSGNPDIATAIAAFGQDWYNWLIMPYTDTANLVALEAELDDRYGPMQQIGGRAFTAYRGNHSATGTFGGTRNSPHVTCMGTNISPTPPYLWAAINAIAAANPLALDPARPLQSIRLKGALPPAINQRWDNAERNLHLYDGMATYKVDQAGGCAIERQVTMYQTNPVGVDDISYLDINRPETLERIRYEQRARVALRFPRHKLSDDDQAAFGAGQPIVTETVIKGELLALYQQFVEDGWCHWYDGYKDSIIVEIDTANGRVNWKDEPRLVGQARTFAGLIQFRI